MTHRRFPERCLSSGLSFSCRFKCARTIIYVLITFSLVAELPSNNYGKSPLIISSKKCLPESAIAEIGRRSKKTSRPPPERRGQSAKLAAQRRPGKPAFYPTDALASAGQRASLEGNKKFSWIRATIFFC
jgi:hypothetical protein